MDNLKAKPFLKWAGGKTQLLTSIEKALPPNFISQQVYIEPFVGSGAVLFWMLNNCTNIKKAIINDVNTDLINSYKTIRDNVKEVIKQLREWEQHYHSFKNNSEQRREVYLEKRTLFNQRVSSDAIQTALFIFLNRTCFNGLYRVNSKNFFNVPIGSYKTPMICDENNLLAVSKALTNVTILNGDFADTINYVDDNSFFYFDPPYKPLSKTSSFNSYAKDEFDDAEQTRLKEFCTLLDQKGHNWILSNSDVKGKDINDNFFDDLYAGYNIDRVFARRSINANPEKRGKLTELLITNYQHEQAMSVA